MMPRYPQRIEKQRRDLAWALRVSGYSWPQIADSLEVDERNARRLVERERARRGERHIAHLEVPDRSE
jgi:DNA-binding transcriptional regulator LsrR (DeoR family)